MKKNQFCPKTSWRNRTINVSLFAQWREMRDVAYGGNQIQKNEIKWQGSTIRWIIIREDLGLFSQEMLLFRALSLGGTLMGHCALKKHSTHLSLSIPLWRLKTLEVHLHLAQLTQGWLYPARLMERRSSDCIHIDVLWRLQEEFFLLHSLATHFCPGVGEIQIIIMPKQKYRRSSIKETRLLFVKNVCHESKPGMVERTRTL